MSEPVFQSSLGTVNDSSTKQDRSWTMGYLAFGKVIRVHHKRGTADVQILRTNETLMSSKSEEGRYSCKIGTSYAGFDEGLKKPYGVWHPLEKGAIVLIAFLRNSKEKPVIINSFHNITEDVGALNYKNILTSVYPLSSPEEMYRYTAVSRIQDFLTISGEGDVEIASHRKSFVVMTDKDISDDYNGFDYENLTIKDKSTKKTIGVDEGYFEPMKFLAVFRDSFIDSATNWIKVFIDPARLVFRLIKMQRLSKTLSMLEIAQDGAIKMRRQLDSSGINKGNNYTELGINADGTINISIKGTQFKLSVTDSGLSIQSPLPISLDSSRVTYKGQELAVKGDSVSESGKII